MARRWRGSEQGRGRERDRKDSIKEGYGKGHVRIEDLEIMSFAVRGRGIIVLMHG